MVPIVLLGLGLAGLAGSALVLASFGPSWRVGRLLAAARRVSIPQARAIADGGRPRYIRVDGRIDAEEPFWDDAQRPLVFRRRRLQVRRRGRWTTVEEWREAVPFVVRDGLESVAVDGDAIQEGLVVVPRDWDGAAGDVADWLPPETPADLPARLRVELVTAVDHAAVVGVPQRRADGTVVLTAGLGRPLILSILPDDEAMRVLAEGRRARSVLAVALLVGSAAALAGGLLALALTVVLPAAVLAASPTPGPMGDPRSAGAGPGLVGAPGLAVLIVVLVGIASALLTLLYVRLTGGARADPDRGGGSAHPPGTFAP